jgi:hypothetical protein
VSMRAAILFLSALLAGCSSREPSVVPPAAPTVRSTRGDAAPVVEASAHVPVTQILPPASPKPGNAKPLTAAEVRARTKEANAWLKRRNAEEAGKQHEACAADARMVIKKMIGCGMDVSGVSVEWMCQKMNPSNVGLLAGTQDCQELRGWLRM